MVTHNEALEAQITHWRSWLRRRPAIGDSDVEELEGHLRDVVAALRPEHTAPYSGSLPWPRTDSQLYEFACHEGNYAMGNTLRGARYFEQEYYEEHGR